MLDRRKGSGKVGELQPEREIVTTIKDKITKGIFHSNRLTHARESRGWSQPELALRVGVGTTAIWNWESGNKVPRRNHLRKLASVFQVSISTFYTEAKDIR